MLDAAPSGPEPGAAHFVGIGFTHDRIGKMRHASRMPRCGASGEAGHREVEAAPEEMHRAAFAEKAGAELREDPINLKQNSPETLRVFWSVGRMLRVLVERNRVGDLVRNAIDA